MTVAFRADANSTIGQGHVMRCLSIADAFSKKGDFCVFATAEETAVEMIEQRGYKAYLLKTSFDNTESEIGELIDFLSKESAEILIIDSYYVTEKYFDALNKQIKTVYLDDVYDFAYNVDCLVNYNVYADRDKYIDMYKKEGKDCPEMIIGPSFAPLRSEFVDTSKRSPDGIKTIALSVGGADPLHLAIGFAKMFSKDTFYDDMKINMILGKMEPDIEDIKALSEKKNNLNVFINIKNMKEMIENADVVISAAGSTQYEICACKRPCICFSMADNQIEGGKKFDELGAFIYAGDARENENFHEDVSNILKDLSHNPKKLARMAEIAGSITDGLGASRMADEIKRIVGRQIWR